MLNNRQTQIDLLNDALAIETSSIVLHVQRSLPFVEPACQPLHERVHQIADRIQQAADLITARIDELRGMAQPAATPIEYAGLHYLSYTYWRPIILADLRRRCDAYDRLAARAVDDFVSELVRPLAQAAREDLAAFEQASSQVTA